MKRSAMVRTPKGFWTCRRQAGGVKCLHVNPNRKQKCLACGKSKPQKSKPKHMAVLTTMTYEQFLEVAGDERCQICGAGPKARRLHRDHDHATGRPRGLLCFQCNTRLPRGIDPAWLRAAADYLDAADVKWRDLIGEALY